VVEFQGEREAGEGEAAYLKKIKIFSHFGKALEHIHPIYVYEKLPFMFPILA